MEDVVVLCVWREVPGECFGHVEHCMSNVRIWFLDFGQRRDRYGTEVLNSSQHKATFR